MSKQSSVEWFIDQIKQYDFAHTNVEAYDIKIAFHIFKSKCEQAKAMHKEEIINAWQKGDGEFDKVAEEMSLEYYNETYGGNP